MLEKLGFQTLVEETITCSRKTRVMSLYKFVLGIVLGRTAVSYSDHYEEKTTFQRLMSRLRSIVSRLSGFKPVIIAPLC